MKGRKTAIMKKMILFARAVAGRFLDRIYKIDRIKKGAGA